MLLGSHSPGTWVEITYFRRIFEASMRDICNIWKKMTLTNSRCDQTWGIWWIGSWFFIQYSIQWSPWACQLWSCPYVNRCSNRYVNSCISQVSIPLVLFRLDFFLSRYNCIEIVLGAIFILRKGKGVGGIAKYLLFLTGRGRWVVLDKCYVSSRWVKVNLELITSNIYVTNKKL